MQYQRQIRTLATGTACPRVVLACQRRDTLLTPPYPPCGSIPLSDRPAWDTGDIASQIQRQFELMAESNGTWRERERRREEKYSQINQGKQTQRENLAEYSARMAERRAERLEAAYRHAEAVRAAALAKVQAVEDRMVRFAEERADHAAMERQRIAALEAKREATYRQNLELLEGRRQAILAHERKVEDMLRQREELRQLQAQIKAEEDFLRDQQRRAIKARAEGDLAERVAHFHAKQAAKEEQASRRIREIEDQRRMRAEELRQRFEYIAAQAHDAAMFAEAERQVLAGKLEDKASRADMLAAHRAALLAEMQNLRHQMQRQLFAYLIHIVPSSSLSTGCVYNTLPTPTHPNPQEEYLRSSLLRMQQLGTVAIPPEVVRSLESVQLAGPLMAEAVLGGGGGGGRKPQLLLEDGGGGGGGYSEGYGGAAASSAREMSSARGVGEALPSPLSTRAQMARVRRPKSAGPTPRGISAFIQRNHPIFFFFFSFIVLLRVPLILARNPAAILATQNSASAVASPVTPTTSGPVPYAPYTVPGARGRSAASFRRQTLEEEVAALEDTSGRAVEAMASGRYSGVHEVSRPGSRREEELRLVLQEEIAKESERQVLLTQVSDEDERSRLVKYFTHEREDARRRILALSSAAQAALYN
ncbi:hypothetical protein VOLCADRAFT_88031 [Volvox carteri f. nagariensis]|uniref:Uncharacterized protein n=1 Tax=Volvox carteri f. nagariensis TaxID=3068 RepID=D8TMW3_VOLCA|nr:uncharacterized protein VOLCADRAFT_88031 [Volvox carteri f. nagariensis]EFJ51198.1 hypothetical protein VOLCADRAFT_88031 [Volvox carteri f. nagariensis]|eukprot:XP_002947665.1 hypothetical protein VOLCADRAFT_88031 [Volvox carteri f. nagariensis]